MRRNDSGFILVAVLVALVVISLLAAAVAVVSERAVAEAQAQNEAFRGEIAMASTRETLFYLLTSQRQTYGGLTVSDDQVWVAGQAIAERPVGDDDAGMSLLPVGNEIRLDGSPYVGLDGAGFALQDDAGRFSPNWTVDAFRPGFLSMLGIPPDTWAGLEAKRLDYQDPDSLYRVGGAETEQYLAAGLPPPSNQPLRTPLELRVIPGWREALASRDDAEVVSLLGASQSVLINVNTASADVLQSIPGVDPETARRIVALRENAPYILHWQFLEEFNLPLDDMAPVGMLAVPYGTMALWHNAGGAVHLLHWTLTPIDEGGRPWRIDYEIILPRDAVHDLDLARTPQTPLFAQPASTGD